MNRAFQLTSFTSYFLDAIDRFSIHSPFVFDFYNTVIRDKGNTDLFQPIEKRRKELLKNRDILKINDKGTGSHTEIDISKIAKISLTRPVYSRLLYRLCVFIEAGITLELGTSLGINTAYLAQGSEEVVTMEGSSAIADVANETFRKLGQQNIRLIQTDITTGLKKTLDEIDRLDLAFIDANHSYKATMKYCDLLMRKAHSETVLVFDDIYWSKEMNRAWKEICADQQVSLSLDLFQFGVVFLNPEFRKQEFTLWVRPW